MIERTLLQSIYAALGGWRQVAALLGNYSGAMWAAICNGKRHATIEQRNLIRGMFPGLLPIENDAAEVVKLITEAQIYKESLRAAFVINRRIVGTGIGREAKAALAEYPLPILTATVAQRIALPNATAYGLTAGEFEAMSDAAGEMAAVTKEVKELVLV